VPIEEKRTFAWIKGLRQCADLAAELCETRQICIMDREADFYELFDEQRKLRGVELLVRAKHDRTLGEDAHLFETVRQSPVKGQLRIPVPRQSDRAKKSKQKARVGHPQRRAQVELRHLQLEIPAPKSQPGKRALTLRVVHVVEPQPPEDTVPLEWFLLTTLTLQTAAHAQACLRWLLPALAHRGLAPGPQERLPHRGPAAQDRRTTEARHRHQPRHRLAHHADDSPRPRMSRPAGRSLVLRSGDRSPAGLRQKKRLDKPTRLGDAVRLVARLGGHIGRASDPPAGHHIMRLGYSELQSLCRGLSLQHWTSD
jgi:hypothetical protein